MDIKILKNADGLKGRIFNGKIIEQSETESEYEGINLIHYYIYDILDGSSREILPSIEKYNIGIVKDCSENTKYLYFANLFCNKDGNKTISIIRYDINENVTQSIYSYEDDFMEYPHNKRLRIFIINDLYIFLQKEYLTYNEKKTYAGFFKFEIKFLNLKDDREYTINDSSMVKNGISDLIMVSENQCAIKTGFSLLVDNRYNELEKDEASLETVSLINLGQMISDLLISQDKIVYSVIEQAFYTKTIPYIKKSGDYLIYTIVDNENKQEEVKFYNIHNGETKNCINQDVIRLIDLAKPYVLNNEPYICITKDNKISFLNINSGKVDSVFERDNSDMTQELVRVFDNSLLFCGSTKKKLLKKSRPFIDIYSFPDEELILHENGEYADCIEKDGELYIIEK